MDDNSAGANAICEIASRANDPVMTVASLGQNETYGWHGQFP